MLTDRWKKIVCSSEKGVLQNFTEALHTNKKMWRGEKEHSQKYSYLKKKTFRECTPFSKIFYGVLQILAKLNIHPKFKRASSIWKKNAPFLYISENVPHPPRFSNVRTKSSKNFLESTTVTKLFVFAYICFTILEIFLLNNNFFHSLFPI